LLIISNALDRYHDRQWRIQEGGEAPLTPIGIENFFGSYLPSGDADDEGTHSRATVAALAVFVAVDGA
jgi:hypothetical protein